MTEPRSFIVRKNSTTSLVVLFAVLGITCLVALCVNIFTDRPSPLDFLNTWFVILGFGFLALAIYIQYAQKRMLTLNRTENGYAEIRIQQNDMIEYELNGDFNIKSVYMEVPTGGKGMMRTMPELYVILYLEEGKPLLSLKDTPGKLGTFSSDFQKVQLGTVVVANVYTCNNVGVVLDALKELSKTNG